MYKRVFNADNPFWSGMGRVFDVFELNVLWLLCCIPVITIGASTTAFYASMMKLVRGEEGYIHQDFFRAFRQNWKQGTKLGLLLSAIGVFLWIDLRMTYSHLGGVYTFLFVIFALLFFFWACVTVYSFPMLATFDNSVKNTLILSFTSSIQHLPQTLMMLGVLALALWICHLLLGVMFLAFGLVVEFHTVLLAALWKPLFPSYDQEEVQGFDEAENG